MPKGKGYKTKSKTTKTKKVAGRRPKAARNTNANKKKKAMSSRMA